MPLIFHCIYASFFMCLNLKVYTEWKEIAEVLRDRVFKENEQHLIDIFDIKV